jgi:hypothetical protein
MERGFGIFEIRRITRRRIVGDFSGWAIGADFKSAFRRKA